jgi:hypothetical protein
MQSLKEQLMEMDFVQEIEKSEAFNDYYIEEDNEYEGNDDM